MIARAVRPFVVLVALAALLAAGPAAAQWEPEGQGLTDATYTSPTYGYDVRWRSAEWTPTTEESSNGSDVLELENTQGEIVRYEATERFGSDPAACRDALLAQIADAPGVSDLDVVPSDEGNLIWLDGMAQAYGLYQYRRESGGETGDWAAYFECRALDPQGSALLALSHIGPSAVYDATNAQLNRVIPSRRTVLPFVEAVQAPGWIWPAECLADALEDSLDGAALPDGSQPSPGTRFFLLRLRLVNSFTAEAPASYEATTIALADQNDVLHYPVRFAWGDVAGDATAAAQAIPPGTAADLTLVYELPEGVGPASVQQETLGPDSPTLALRLACLNPRNGLSARPQDGGFVEPQVSFVMNPDGSEAGMVTWLDGATLPGEGDVVLLRFTNTGGADWRIDPHAIVGENRFNQPELIRPTPAAVALLDPQGGGPTLATAPVTLAPGESVDVRFTFAEQALGCTWLTYAAEPDQAVPLGRGPCSAGSGLRPKLRTSG